MIWWRGIAKRGNRIQRIKNTLDGRPFVGIDREPLVVPDLRVQTQIRETGSVAVAELSGVRVAGERIVESFGRGLSNYVIGIAPVFGYTTLVTDKGNKIFLEFSGSSETRPTETGSKRGTYRGTARFVGGTGQFSNIRGYLVEEAKYDTDPKTGYNFGEFRGEYWFEQ